jgi:tetratricopeptide (TPR) repeat protein
LHAVYSPRIARFDEFYSTKKLSAYGADLAALAGLFDLHWDDPVATLTEADQAFILHQAAVRLRAIGRLRDALPPLVVGLERRAKQESWGNAAINACSLSELHLTLGYVAEAVAVGEASVAHADRDESIKRTFLRVYSRSTWANALHQKGEPERARTLFEEAEALEAKAAPWSPWLESVQGYYYCDLLLAHVDPAEVRARASSAIASAETNNWVRDIALGRCSLGLAELALGMHGEARAQLGRALDGLRQAGRLDQLPRGLLARAALFRATDDSSNARRDLDEAMRIAKRSEMRLFQCDAHLEYARLALAEGNREKAREHVVEARRLVEETGYGRRRPEVEELEAEVG